MRFNARKLTLALTLATLAAGSWWLTRLASEPAPAFDGKMRHDPDFIVENFHSIVMAETGRPQYEIRGGKLLHFGDDGSSEIERPYFIQHTPGRAALHARAVSGFVPQDSAYIRLTGDVHVAQGQDPRSAGGSVRTREMTVRLDRSR